MTSEVLVINDLEFYIVKNQRHLDENREARSFLFQQRQQLLKERRDYKKRLGAAIKAQANAAAKPVRIDVVTPNKKNTLDTTADQNTSISQACELAKRFGYPFAIVRHHDEVFHANGVETGYLANKLK